MIKQPLSKLKQIQADAQVVLDEDRMTGRQAENLSRFQRLVHFVVLVVRSFLVNRCPVRASALTYTTLLALIPMLGVGLSFATVFLHGQRGQETVREWISKGIESIAPQLGLVSQAGGDADAQKKMVDFINSSIAKVSSGTLGTTAMIALLCVAVSLLANIEKTLNDIWGVARGRSWFDRVLQYSFGIIFGPMLLMAALGLNLSSHFEPVRNWLGPTLVAVGSQLMPVLLLALTFALFYKLMPNVRVQWKPALVGGLVGAVLLHLNNAFSTIYFGQVVRNSKIYGSLGIIPVFLVGLYFSWLILLFGAQVSYAWQNRRSYLQEKVAENMTPRGRESAALCLMTFAARRFRSGQSAPTVLELGEAVNLPTRAVRRILDPLTRRRLLVEVTGGTETAFAPARPLDQITCHDVLEALRCGQGEDFSANSDLAMDRVRVELEKVQEAERTVAGGVTLEQLAG